MDRRKRKQQAGFPCRGSPSHARISRNDDTAGNEEVAENPRSTHPGWGNKYARKSDFTICDNAKALS